MEQSRRKIRPTTIAAIALAALLVASGAIAEFYTDALWYGEVGQTGVFWRTLAWQWGTGVAFGLVFFAILLGNLTIARKMTPVRVLRPAGTVGLPVEVAIDRVRDAVGRIAGTALLVASGVAALVAGAAMAESWEVFALATSGGLFGATDPQFGRDIGFYFFTLPALRLVQAWLTGTLVFTLIASAALHVFNGSIRPWDRWRGFDPHVKAHLSVVGGFVVVVQALGYWLSIFELVYSPRGQVVGASFTDVNAQIPAYTILIVIALLSGIALLVNIRFRGWRLPVVAVGAWVGAAILVGGVYPGLVQQFRVSPNEVEAESPYIERNIAATRAAYGLEDIEVRAFPAEENLTAENLTANTQTIRNVRVWDPTIVVQTYRQLQGIRPYYDFNDVDVDRYTVDGVRRQVLVSVREMNVARLADQAQTWVNQHLVYTHGYGIVVSPVNETSGQGYPLFIVKDIPPESGTDLEVAQPAIYFGEQVGNYVIANTELPEFDYPVGSENAETTYAGQGGIEVGGPLRRAAFALRFSAPQIVFSRYIRSDSQVLFRRSITERAEALAPWLTFDGDPYPAIIDDRIVWILDGYTVSDRYPYSERYGGANYIRNSVKMTVDAYDGTTTLYAFDPDDPLLEAWSRVFPDLLTDASEMPESVRAHLRYPADLFMLQAEVYKTYHMLDPKVFYNKEDQWALPGEGTEGGGVPMDPFYVLMELPEEDREDFMLMLPFTPRTKANMIGWMAAKSDPDDYGARVVYTLPKQRLVLGPEQVSARINQDPIISQQLTLWSQRGSGVIFGNLLVIPIEEAIVYIQPLYLQAEQTAMPQLTRVIVAYGDTVAMETDLAAALLRVFGEVEVPATDGGAPADPAAALELYERALEAQRTGDWAAYGRLIGELGDVLGRLSGAAVETTVTPAQ
ncbi:MAG: UPF0182 family protein [Coriobacteriia bacterium]|nr:UPF0182 family protein [Coriobacteriia bacterium]